MAGPKFGPPVKGVLVLNKKYLLQTVQTGQGDTSNATNIWTNRERLANHLTGKEPTPVQPIVMVAMFSRNAARKWLKRLPNAVAWWGNDFRPARIIQKAKWTFLVE